MLLITGPQRARSKINWARVVLEPAIALAVVPELETAPVVALALELVQVAVALRTKSATAAHRQDLVPLLTAEASAVAGVETSLAPAAAEAAIAWAGADSAADAEVAAVE